MSLRSAVLLLLVGLWAAVLPVLSGAQKAPKPQATAEAPPTVQPLDAGGPDAFGYSWIDSNDPLGPVYDWIDIAPLGTRLFQVSGADDAAQAVALPFAFPFYGQAKSTAYVGSNGLLSFASAAADDYEPYIPDSSTPNDMIALFGADLDPSEGGSIYTYHDAANDRFIVQYDRVRDYSETGYYTAQMLLYSDGRIVFQYNDVATGEAAEEATVGIENADGSDGLAIVDSGVYLEDGLAISIGTEPLSGPTFTSTPAPSVAAGEAYTYAVAAESRDGVNTGLTLAAPTLPAWLTFADNGSGSGTLSGSPTAADIGPHDVVLRVEDGSGESEEQTFTVQVTQALSGTYTVGSGGDYASVADAVDALELNGVAGPVTLALLSGTYTTQVDLGPVPGTSATNTISFTAQSGSAADVTLRFSGSSATGSHVVELRDTRHVRFQSLTLEGDDASGFDVVSIVGTVEDVVFRDVAFMRGYRALRSNEATLTGLRIEDSTLEFDDEGVSIIGLSATPSSDITITGSTFRAMSRSSSTTGLILQTVSNATVEGNTIRNVGTGMRLSSIDAPAAAPGRIVNNVVQATREGMRFVEATHHRVVHNTVEVNERDGVAVYHVSRDATGLVWTNNLFAVTGEQGGEAVAFVRSARPASDHNVWYTTGAALASIDRAPLLNLAAYQNATGLDANSRSVDPVFTSPTDWTPGSTALDAAGTPLASVPTDINGAARSTTAPSVGAIEYTRDAAPLSGTLTVGDAGAYPTLGAVVYDLRTRGISGPVTVEVAPGTYEESVTLGPIPGTSATQRVTIAAQSGAAADVVVQHQAAGDDDNFVLRLFGTDYVTIEHLTLRATDRYDARAVVFGGQLDGVTLQHLVLEGSTLSSTYRRGDRYVVVGHSPVTTDFRFQNNTVRNGSMGLNIAWGFGSDDPPPSTGTVLRDNVFTHERPGGDTYAIFVEYHTGIEVVGNEITDRQFGVNLQFCDGALRILRNRLFVNRSGLRLYAGSATEAAPALVANNIVRSVGTSGSDTGLSTARSVHYRVYHNTLWMAGGGTALDVGESTAVRNNLLASGGGRALQAPFTPTGITSDFNDLYTTGASLVRWGGTEYADLATYQTGTAQGGNSAAVDPAFASDTDLTPTATVLDDAGTPLAAVPTDAFGTARSTTAPSLGAIEYTAVQAPLAGTYVVGTGGDYPTLRDAVDVLRTAGMSDAVTLELESGTYDEQVEIGAITGASAATPLVITSATGTPGDVTLRFAATGTANNFVVRLNGTDHVRFEALTIEAAGATYARALDITGSASDVAIQNVALVGPSVGASSDARAALLHAHDTVTSGLRVERSTFTGGGSSLHLAAPSSTPSTGTTITGNTMAGGGLLLDNHQASVVEDNAATGSNGWLVRGDNGALRVLRNRIDATGAPGLRLEANRTGSGSPARIANNVIRTTAANAVVVVQSSDHQAMHHNTLVQEDESGRGLVVEGASAAIDLRNTLIATQGGAALVAPETGVTSDHNGFFAGASTEITEWGATQATTLGNHQAASGQDANSRAVPPVFGADEATPRSRFLDDEGTPLASVPTDLSGTPRSSTAPSIGAIEYASSATARSGTYTVGGSGDFASLASAIDALAAGGLSGATTLSIAPGTYTTHLTLPSVPGASETAPLTLTSSSGTAADVTLQHAASGTNDNYVLRLHGTDHLRIANVTLQASGPVYARALVLRGAMRDVRLQTSILRGTPGNGSRQALLYGDGLSVQSLTVQDNTLVNFGQGILLRGETNRVLEAVSIRGTTFRSTTAFDALRVEDVRDLTIEGNVVEAQDAEAPEIQNGLSVVQSAGGLQVRGNRVVASGVALSVGHAGASGSDRGLVANNILSGTTALVIDPSMRLDVVHNSTRAAGSANAEAVRLRQNSTSDVVLRNNIFFAEEGAALDASNATGIDTDHNALFTYGRPLVRWGSDTYDDLAGYRSGTGQGASSLSAAPFYRSRTDLTPTNAAFQDAGTPVAAVATDINGDARSSTAPALGAVEIASGVAAVDVTVQVDLRQMVRLGVLDPSGPARPFVDIATGGSPRVVFLDDTDGDGVWTATLSERTGDDLAYAFGIDEDGARVTASDRILERGGPMAARTLTVPDAALVVPTALFDDRPLQTLAPNPDVARVSVVAPGPSASFSLRTTETDGYLTAVLAGLDRRTALAGRYYRTDPGGALPAGIAARSGQAYWALDLVPAQAQYTADVVVDYSRFTGIADPSDLRLMHRATPDAAWTVVATVRNGADETLTATAPLAGEWTIGSASDENPLQPTRPSAITLSSPLDGAGVRIQDAQLTWARIDEAETIDVYVWPEGTSVPDTPTVAGLDGSVTRTDISALISESTTYRWKVVARNYHGTRESASQTFLTRDLPDLTVTAVQAPDDAARFGTITVTWTVTNSSSASTGTSAWYDYLWLSRDRTQNPPEGPNSGDFLLGRFPNVAALDPGESYTATQTVTLPQRTETGDVAGNKVWERYLGETYLFAQADNTTADVDDTTEPPTVEIDAGTVRESDESNNERSRTLTISRPPPADLFVASFVAPNTVFSGSSVDLAFTVANEASDAVTDSDAWPNAVYLSDDDVLDRSQDQRLFRADQTGGLAPGDTSDVITAPVVVPREINGDYTLFLVVNEDETVYEQGRLSNNVVSRDLSVTLTPPPDLVVSDVTVPPTANSGTSLSVAYTLANQGPGSLPATDRWTDVVEVVAGTTYDPQKVVENVLVSRSSGLLASGPATVSIDVPLADSLDGPVTIAVTADVRNAVFEFDQDDNNRTTASLDVTRSSAPDLTVRTVSINDPAGAPLAEATAGDRVQVAYTVENVGPGATPAGGWTDYIWISDAAAFSDATARLVRRVQPTNALAPADGTPNAYTRTALVTLPDDLDGAYYVYVRTNSDDALYEHGNTASNIGRSSDAVSVAPRPPAPLYDLALDAVVVTSTDMRAGTDPAAVELTVSNRGPLVPEGVQPRVALSWVPESGSGRSVSASTIDVAAPLASGATVTRSLEVPVSETLDERRYTLVAELSWRADVEASNDTAASAVVDIAPAQYPNFFVSEVTASAAAVQSGETVTVTWAVGNNGTKPPERSWYDGVAFSSDLRLDVDDPVLALQRVEEATIGLSVGGSYTQTAEVTIPATTASGSYYLLAVADARPRNDVREINESDNQNAVLLGVTLAPPSDLVASNVQIPATALSGETVTVTYTLTNVGANPAVGTLSDAIYFSSDAVFDPGDALLGVNAQTINLLPEQSTTVAAEVNLADVLDPALLERTAAVAPDAADQVVGGSLPGLTPGDYFAVVRVNARRTIREDTYDGNETPSEATLTADVPALSVGESVVFAGAETQPVYYRFEATGGQDLNVALEAPAGVHEVYVAEGRLPTRASYDRRSSVEATTAPRVVLPQAAAGTYYVLAYPSVLPTTADLTLAVQELDFAIERVHTDRIGDFGSVSLEITGSQFREGATVALQRGGVQVQAEEVLFFGSTELLARFEVGAMTRRFLEAADGTIIEANRDVLAHGRWDVAVANPDGRTAILPEAVTAEPREDPVVDVSVDIPPTVVIRQTTPATLRVYNPTNVDVENALVRLTMPAESDLTVASELEDVGLEPWDQDRETWIDDEGMRNVEFFVFNIPPRRSKVIPITFRARTGGRYDFRYEASVFNDIEFTFALQLMLQAMADRAGMAVSTTDDANFGFGTLDAQSLLASNASVPQPLAGGCSGVQSCNQGNECSFLGSIEQDLCELSNQRSRFQCALDKIRAFLNNKATSTAEGEGKGAVKMTVSSFLSRLSPRLAGALRAYGLAALPISIWTSFSEIEKLMAEIDEIMNGEDEKKKQNGGPADCEEEECEGQDCDPDDDDNNGPEEGPAGGTNALGSCDPNDMLGPDGYGAERWVSVSDRLSYTIRFENDPVLATAPARRVEIRHPLDEDLALGTFALGPVTFGSFEFAVPPGRSYYSTRFDVRDSLGVYVDLIAGIDVTKREAFWIFESIDPATGTLSTSPLLGFLPVNDDVNRGQGTVLYTIAPSPQAPSGARIDAVADILFDDNAIIPTPAIFNTIDSGPPQSLLAPLRRSANTDEIVLQWSGEDGPGEPGVQSYDVYVAKNSQPFERRASALPDTSYVFTGERGHRYAFYVRARDYAGNEEPPKADAEANIVLGQAAAVYPGDANNDGRVDETDVLDLGTYFGTTGPARTASLMTWDAQTVPAWRTTAAAFADADGSGRVDQNDLLPIGTYFGRSRPEQQMRRAAPASAPAPQTLTLPPLPVGTSIPVTVRVGSDTRPLADLLGVAVRVEARPDLFHLDKVEVADAFGTAPLTFQRRDADAGRLVMAATRVAADGGLASAGQALVTLTYTVKRPMEEHHTITLTRGTARRLDGDAPSEAVRIESPRAVEAPSRVTLEGNYPNPVQAATTIRFGLTDPTDVRLVVYDMLGRRVAVLRDGELSPGWHAVRFDASRLASGVYFYRLHAGSATHTQKMVIVR